MSAITLPGKRLCTVRVSFASSCFLLLLTQFVVGLYALATNDHALQEVRPSESQVPIARSSVVPEQKLTAPVNRPSSISEPSGSVNNEEKRAIASPTTLQHPSVDADVLPSHSRGGTTPEHSTVGHIVNDAVAKSPRAKKDEPTDLTASSVPPNPTRRETIEEVFVPLKEWKQKKLEDIESRVRQINELDATEDATAMPHKGPAIEAQRSVRIVKSFATGICSVPVISFPWLSIPHKCRCSVDMFRAVEGLRATSAPAATSDQVALPYPTNTGGSRRPAYADINFEASTDKAGLLAYQSSASSFTEYGNFSLPYGPVSKLYAIQQLKNQERPSFDVASSNESFIRNRKPRRLIEQQEPGFFVADLMGLPVVGDIMRSLREASNLLTYSPRAPVPFSFRNSAADVPPSRRCTSTAVNHSCEHFEEVMKGSPTIGGQQQADVRAAREKQNGDRNVSADEMLSGAEEDNDLRSGTGRSATEKPFNFASADAGARILSSSNGIVGAKNVIEGSVDKYLLAPCTAGIDDSRWIEIELSEDVILESLETGNFEYYSSSAKKLVVFGAGSYPPTKWNLLGVFDFADVRSMQRFRIEKRVVTKYLRILFAGKQGHEYYCPISTIRAFGKNLIADWKDVFENPVAGAVATDERVADQRKPVEFANGPGLPRIASAHATTERSRDVSTKRSVSDTGCHSRVLASPRSQHANRASETPPTAQGPDHQEEIDADQMNDVKQMPHREGIDSASFAAATNAQNADDAATDLLEPSGTQGDNGLGVEKSQAMGESPEEPVREAMSEDDQIVLEAVRADALSSVSGDDNIFRKVTRLIRMLELNQTLTNQYIDTHLSRFAKALSRAQLESSKARELTDLTEQRLIRLVTTTEQTVRELRSSAVKRDILLCVLIVCVAFLLGTHWVLWTAVSGARVHSVDGRAGDASLDMRLSSMDLDEGVQMSYVIVPESSVGSTPRGQLHEARSLGTGTQLGEAIRSGRVRSVSSTALSTMAPHNSCVRKDDQIPADCEMLP